MAAIPGKEVRGLTGDYDDFTRSGTKRRDLAGNHHTVNRVTLGEKERDGIGN